MDSDIIIVLITKHTFIREINKWKDKKNRYIILINDFEVRKRDLFHIKSYCCKISKYSDPAKTIMHSQSHVQTYIHMKQKIIEP